MPTFEAARSMILLRANGIAVPRKDRTLISPGEEVAVHLPHGDAGMLEE